MDEAFPESRGTETHSCSKKAVLQSTCRVRYKVDMIYLSILTRKTERQTSITVRLARKHNPM